MDQSKNIQAAFYYDAYGAPFNGMSSNGAADPWMDNARSGYYSDNVNSLVVCANRIYDASAGRWITRDPIGFGGGQNVYAYCAGYPLMRSDPSGLDLGLFPGDEEVATFAEEEGEAVGQAV